MLFQWQIYAQVGVGTLTPDNSAGLDITATDKGLLIPRISLSDVADATSPVNNPATGLLVWNTNAGVTNGHGVGFYFFNGAQWQFISKSNTLDEAYDQGGAGAGRTITADADAVTIEGTDGLVVTGNFGSGATISGIPANTPRMFFNPRKAAFRAGSVNSTQWDDANVGNYSFATGLNTTASGENSFAAGDTNTASGENASAFGFSNTASGVASFVVGSNNVASGENAFASGNNTSASGKNSFTSGNHSEAISVNEVAVGSYPTTYTLNAPDNATFNSADRALVVGIGTGTGNRKNALEIWKDGSVIINDAYTLPKTDGTADQLMVTDGSGNLSWSDNYGNVVSQSLYAADNTFNYNDTDPSDDPTTKNLNNFETTIIPTLYDNAGDIRIKLVVRLSAMTGNVEFRLRAKDGTSTSYPISFNTTQTYTTTATGGVVETVWKNWAAGTAPYEIRLQAQTENGESISVTNAYIMIKSQ